MALFIEKFRWLLEIFILFLIKNQITYNWNWLEYYELKITYKNKI